MALVKCPECESMISSHAQSCPHCGFPDIAFHYEVERLKSKIKSVDFKYPEPRIKVCLKCSSPFFYHKEAPDGKPLCECKFGDKTYPGVEIDFYNSGYLNDLSEDLYMLNQCVIPRNIGDTESQEYAHYVSDLMRQVNASAEATGKPITESPPNPEYINNRAPWTRPDYTPPKPIVVPTQNVPTCPICKSTSLTKITTAQKAGKIALFGVFGMGDSSKTWKCNKCGSKF